MQPSIEECAAIVYFGEWITVEECPEHFFAEKETPESFLLKKEFLSQLSEESKVLVEILIGLPSEFFMVNGVVKKGSLHKLCREKYGWSATETEQIKLELAFFLKALNPSARKRRKNNGERGTHQAA